MRVEDLWRMLNIVLGGIFDLLGVASFVFFLLVGSNGVVWAGWMGGF